MSKIVFFCIPAHGHTNPTLGVVRELVSRGHQVWYYSYNMMREKIESAGATFISCDDYDTEQTLNAKDSARMGKDLAFSTKILVDTTLALDEKVCREMAELQRMEESFRVLLCTEGCGVLFMKNELLSFFKGDCIFVPANTEQMKLHGKAELLCCQA